MPMLQCLASLCATPPSGAVRFVFLPFPRVSFALLTPPVAILCRLAIRRGSQVRRADARELSGEARQISIYREGIQKTKGG